ncbi:MAG: peptide chain release factor N(5)-glutamine methyltransferase [Candidatus Omnitrophica bacterium]|nr:peptide chain release factor N(5)-glutamine methyltransferase [Candidatus Omnitrophota bacterium]
MSRVAYFLDFEFDTENAAFYPRPETELLVEKAVGFLPERFSGNILDIGTGCGNIAISLTKYIPSCRITALDISDTALRAARQNAAKYGTADRIEFVRSDLFEGLCEKYVDFFDLIVTNPPYVSRSDFTSLPMGVKDDPYIALYGGPDGTDCYRKIIGNAPHFLKKNGILLMEIGYNQSESVRGMLVESGSFFEIVTYKDYSGIERIIKARRI